MLGSETQPQPRSPASALTHKAPEAKNMLSHQSTMMNINGVHNSGNEWGMEALGNELEG
jgi:hypothetical protein